MLERQTDGETEAHRAMVGFLLRQASCLEIPKARTLFGAAGFRLPRHAPPRHLPRRLTQRFRGFPVVNSPVSPVWGSQVALGLVEALGRCILGCLSCTAGRWDVVHRI